MRTPISFSASSHPPLPRVNRNHINTTRIISDVTTLRIQTVDAVIVNKTQWARLKSRQLSEARLTSRGKMLSN